MEITLPIFHDLSLRIADQPNERSAYPTWRLQKGLLMSLAGQDLAEEAVGFGMPVLNQGLQTIFPGDIQLNLPHRDSNWEVTATYTMNLVEKIARRGAAGVNSKGLYAAKNLLAAFIRQVSPARAPLTVLSSVLRRFFGWETIYEYAGDGSEVRMLYRLDEQEQVLRVEAVIISPSQPGVTELIVMNEQGAHAFDQYRDSSGTCLSGEKIGCWDEVSAEEASFLSSTHRVAFCLPRVAGTRMFRGRELIGSRLAWAGFGYSISPSRGGFRYTIRFEKIP